MEDTGTLKASLVDWKDREHPLVDWKSLRKLFNESRLLTKSPVSNRINKFFPSIVENSPMGPRHKDKSLRAVKKRISPESWGNSLMSRINKSFPSSPMNQEGEEENFPQWTTHHLRLPCRSKLPRRLHHGPPTHSSASYSPQWILHQVLPCELELPRSHVHISYRNWICRHRPHTSQKRRVQNL